MKKRNFFYRYNVILNAALLLIVSFVLIFSIFLVRTKLLENAQNLGMALTYSYAKEEEMNLSDLEGNLMIISQYLDEMTERGSSFQEVQQWMEGYYNKFTGAVGRNLADIYAVVDGKIVAANPWEGDEDYIYEETAWYRQALEAEGKMVSGNVYQDVITGQRVLTVSKALEKEGDVVAMDIFVENPDLHQSAQTMPEGCSYFLCDQDGLLIYANAMGANDPDGLQSYADEIMRGIADGSLLSYDAFLEDLNGNDCGIYYRVMNNGWTAVMTIPSRSILMGEMNATVYLMSGLALILFLLLAFMTIHDAVRSRVLKKADDTIRILGESFHAVFRINVEEGTYEGIKTYQDLEENLPENGAYALFVDTMRLLVKPEVYQAFKENFSLENIRKRIDQGVTDYGGDYQRRFGDTYRWVNIRTLYNRKLAPGEVILCFRDVDEEKRRELKTTILLQDALDAARRSTEEKLAFFSRMSHDMRTPLNAVIGCCELAEKSQQNGDTARVSQYLQKIEFAGKQLLELINDILELSRAEAVKDSLDQKELNLEKLLTRVADIFLDRAEQQRKNLEVSINFQNPVVIADENKIINIVNNLLSNAFKYSDPGDSISLKARQFDFQQHSKYQIIVEDTGIGMSDSFLEHLFDPYVRETVFSSHPVSGTGLGMPIVKSLVQQMNGEITVESTLGEGSRFTVTLPLEVCEGGEIEEKTDVRKEKNDSGLTGRNILVAEDNDLNREIITEILRQFGADVVTAENGEEAVGVFLSSQPYSVDAVLMDMQMPVMDGCQASEAIRALEREDAASVPIIAVTANVSPEDIARTARAGIDDHISKPINSEMLKQTLIKLIGECERNRRTSGQEEV